MSRDQDAGRSHSSKTDNKSFERVEYFKYLGKTQKNKNYVKEETKNSLKSGNACCQSVQNLVSSSLILKIINIKTYRTVVLPVVLYGCETWSLTLREERRMRMIENRVLRRTFGPMRDEITGEWRKLHTEEPNDLYSSRNIFRFIKSRRMRWAGHVPRMGESRGVYRVLMRKPEGKGPLGRHRQRWEDNIKMDLQEVGWGGMDWIDMAQGKDRWWALVKVVMKLRVSLNAGTFLTS